MCRADRTPSGKLGIRRRTILPYKRRRREYIESRQLIGDLEPRRFRTDEHVKSGPESKRLNLESAEPPTTGDDDDIGERSADVESDAGRLYHFNLPLAPLAGVRAGLPFALY